jgi:hypothetical protein
MKTTIFLFAIVCVLLSSTVGAQNYSQLKTIDEYNFRVFYSQDCDERAKLISKRVDKAKEYFEKLLDFSPAVTILILSADDWSKYTNFP